MKKAAKELARILIVWLVLSALTYCLLSYTSSFSEQAISTIFINTCSIAMATLITYFYVVARNLPRFEKKYLQNPWNRRQRSALLVLLTFVLALALGGVLWKLTAIITGEQISFRTLCLLSLMGAIPGTVIAFARLGPSKPSAGYIGPVRGDVLFFEMTEPPKDSGTEPTLLLCPVQLWDVFQEGIRQPDIGLPKEVALCRACRSVEVFESENCTVIDRLKAVVKAGCWVGILDSGSDRDMLTGIYQKCCQLLEDEVVSLTEDERVFLSSHKNEEVST